MSEEILAQESEETSEEEVIESSEQDSSDDLTGEEVEEGKTAKASVKKEQEDDEEEDSEEEEPAEEEKKVKKEAVSVPSTKNQMLKNIYDQVNGMLKGDLATKYEEIMAATDLETVKEEEVKEDEVRTKAAVKAEDIKVDVKDDVEALVQGEEGLTEDFKEKASTIFEAAVQAKVVEEVNNKMEELDAQLKSDASTETTEFAKELTEKVDGYLTYIVEEWMQENELAIERGIRTELVEDFMSGLRTLFTEHYIDIPEEKVDMVDDLFTKVEDLETQLKSDQDTSSEEFGKELTEKVDGYLTYIVEEWMK